MAFFSQFRNVSESDKGKAVEKLIKVSTPDYDFFLMVTLSVLMATAGLLLDNLTIVLGSVLIAPVLFPILSLSLGVVMSDHKLISRSIYTTLKMSGIAVLGAVIITFAFFPTPPDVLPSILEHFNSTLLAFTVAVISGIAVSVALVRTELSETLPGIAVSVSILPPLAAVGVGITWLDWIIVSKSLVFLVFNILGVVFSSLASFSLLNLYVKRHVAQEIIKEEEQRVEKEEEKAEKLAADNASE